jgi:hypothetical protein
MKVTIPEWEEPKRSIPATEEDIRNSNSGGVNRYLAVGERLEFPDVITVDDFRFVQTGAIKVLMCKVILNGNYSWIGVATLRRRPVDFEIHFKKWPDMLRLAEIDNDWDRIQSLAGETIVVVSNEEMDIQRYEKGLLMFNPDGTPVLRKGVISILELESTLIKRGIEANRKFQLEMASKQSASQASGSSKNITANSHTRIEKPTNQYSAPKSVTSNKPISIPAKTDDTFMNKYHLKAERLSRLSNRELAEEYARIVTIAHKQHLKQDEFVQKVIGTVGRWIKLNKSIQTNKERLDCGVTPREDFIERILQIEMGMLFGINPFDRSKILG